MNRALVALLVLVVIYFFYRRRGKGYGLDVTIEPQEAASISEITYTKGPGYIIAEFSLDIQDGYMIKRWTGTLPRLEGYDPARWYDSITNRVRLEITRNEELSIHFARLNE